MELQSPKELEVAQERLRALEDGYEEASKEPCEDQEVREAELQSFNQLINEFKEQIIRFECENGLRVTKINERLIAEG